MKSVPRSLLAAFALSGPLAFGGAAIAGSTLYVDDSAPAGGDGLSWGTAHRFLQDALFIAAGGGVTEIRVGQGVQFPDRDIENPDGTQNQAATFALLNGVALRGGYAGIGAFNPDDRDFDQFETVLLGDLLGDDGPDFENYGENSGVLVTATKLDTTAELDGFTVRAANGTGLAIDGAARIIACTFEANLGKGVSETGGTSSFMSCSFVANNGDRGAGMTTSGEPTLTDCAFTDNVATRAAAMDCAGAAQMTRCVFLRNEGLSRAPGAVEIRVGHSRFAECLFEENISHKGAGAVRVTSGIGTFEDSVFRLNETTLLDGGAIENLGSLTLVRCVFEENTAQGNGGAIAEFGRDFPVAIVDCTFRANRAQRGAGIFADRRSGGDITGCGFVSNVAGTGAGVYLGCRTTSVLTNCTFDGNLADVDGGGIATDDSEAQIIDCILVRNEAARNGGGIANVLESRVTIRGSLFDENEAVKGGGVFNQTESVPLITGCMFSANRAVTGAGLANEYRTLPTIVDCTFLGNVASSAGGGMSNTEDSSPVIDRCAFLGNSATALGGGMYSFDGSRPVVSNSAFSGNTATEGGGVRSTDSSERFINCTFAMNSALFGAAVSSYGSPDLTNCIVWDNGDEPIDDPAPVLARYCDIEGGHAGLDIIDADPLFIDALGADGVAGTLDDDLRIAAGSPVIDRGDSNALPGEATLDLGGSPRFFDDPDTPNMGLGIVPFLDLGAYEFTTGCAADADGDGDVGFSDILAILAAWGPCPGCPEDIDGDGDAGFGDILIVLSQWGPCP